MAEVTSSPLGKRIAVLRKKRGLTKEQLQERAGLGSGYLSKLEEKGRPKRPGDETIQRIADALGVPRAELEGGTGGGTFHEIEDPYPTRQQAIALLEEDERISPGTLKALRLVALADGKDPGLKVWLRRAAEIERDKQEAKRERDAMFDVKPGRG
jgi:transcriptional regulator with XRE-family HTH domain